jgi:hypothetical protein
MEAFLLVMTIITTLALLLSTQRFNHNIARYMPVGTKVYPQGQPLYLANIAGKWLTLAGGTATIPMVMGLIFIPESTSFGWTVTLGAIGFVTLMIAGILLVSACIGQCITRKISAGQAVISIFQGGFKKALRFFSYKVMLWIAGTFIVALLFPFLMDLVLFAVFAAVFFVFVQLGMLSNSEINSDDDGLYFGYIDNDYYYMAYDNDYHHEDEL